MYAVIFRSTIRILDEDYQCISKRVRELAFTQYNCVDFVATVEGDQEIAISYWRSLDDIKAWRNNAEHQEAIRLAKERWFSSYRIDVTEVQRSYEST